MFGLALMVGAITLAIAAPLLAPYEPTSQHSDGLTATGAPQGVGTPGFVLGTDTLGRDTLSRLLYAGRTSLFIALSTSGLALVLGLTWGGLAAMTERFGPALMRFADLVLSIPALLLGVIVLAVTEPTPITLIIVMGISFSAFLSRIVYTEASSIRQRDFVRAVTALGLPAHRIVLRHVLPHVLPSAVVYAALATAAAVQLEAAFSFVGLGIQPPDPSWGNMISEGQAAFRLAPRLVFLPGAAVMITTLGFAIVGDALRDALDPSIRGVGFALAQVDERGGA